MPRNKSNAKTPAIMGGILYTDDIHNGARVGSPDWFAFLDTLQSFYFESGQGLTFTARPEKKQRGGVYWIAYRKVAGKLRKAYLGAASAITADRLAEIALKLADRVIHLALEDNP